MNVVMTKKRTKSRSRGANWNVSQTSLLLKLLKKKEHELGEDNFDGEIWRRIAAILNKKSRPQRKAEQVRMRLKTLKAEFTDYRTCVEMPGWGWDSRKKLPIAPSETSWNEAIKSNKRLSKCRTKAFPWYKQIAEICGAEVPVGENEPSGSTNEAMEEDILPLAVSGPGAGTEQSSGPNSADDVSSSSGKRTRDELEEELQISGTDATQGSPEAENKQTKCRIRNANWTDHQTTVLLNLMLDQYDSGITDYTQAFWKQLCKALNEKTQPQRKAAELSNRFKTLKTDFSDYRFCAETWGWSWDNEQGLPIAPNDACWVEITKINKKFQRCRNKPFGWYEQVAKLINKSPEMEHHKLSRQPSQAAKKASNPHLVPSNSPRARTEQSNNSADGTPPSIGIELGRHTQAKERNTERMQETPNMTAKRKKLLEYLPDLTPSIYKEPSGNPGAHTEQSNNSAGDTPPSTGTESGCHTQAKEINPEGMQKAPNKMVQPNKLPDFFLDLTPSVYKETTNNYKIVAKKLVRVRSQLKLSRLDFTDMSVIVRDELNRELFMEQEGKELSDWIQDSLEMYREQRKAQQSANRPFFMPVFPYPPGGPYTPPPHLRG